VVISLPVSSRARRPSFLGYATRPSPHALRTHTPSLAQVVAHRADSGQVAEIRDAFMELDSGKEGYITLDELQKVCGV